MLHIARSMRELDFPGLMEVYAESNRENGETLFPEEPAQRQRMLAEEGFRDYLREDFFSVPGAAYYIWLEDGAYVCALRLEPYRDGLLLEALETAPAQRRKGYAAGLMAAALADAGAVKIYSHVGKRNVGSLAVHEKCGFRRIAEHAAYIDGSVDRRCCTLCHEWPAADGA